MPEAHRVAFLGIGHPLRRDDAAGVEVCERMRPALDGRPDVLVVRGGSAPENCVGVLRAFAPDLVVVIDAARMGQPPGTILRIAPSDPRAAGASTHTLPLPAFCEYVQATLGCQVALLGIEPADTSFGEGLTPAVERAVEQVAKGALAQLDEESGRPITLGTALPRPAGDTFEPRFKPRHSRESRRHPKRSGVVRNPKLQEPGPPLPLRDALPGCADATKRHPRGRRDLEGALSPRVASLPASLPRPASGQLNQPLLTPGEAFQPASRGQGEGVRQLPDWCGAVDFALDIDEKERER